VQRLSGLDSNDLQVGFPYIAADKAQVLDHRRPQRLQPLPQRPLRPPLTDEQQPPAMAVNLSSRIAGRTVEFASASWAAWVASTNSSPRAICAR
jgi:hypothetical protein